VPLERWRMKEEQSIMAVMLSSLFATEKVVASVRQ